MSDFKLKAYAATTALTTELNALANNANTAASAAIDNTTLLYPYADIEIVVGAQGSARTAGAVVKVFMTVRTDATNFGDTNETTAELVAVFPLDAATTARRLTRRSIPLPPEQYKLFARNETGQALAATLNTVKVMAYYLQVV